MISVFITTLQILGSGVVAALVAAFVSARLQQRASVIANKRDVLRRLVGYRFSLTTAAFGNSDNGEPFVALNEILVVYADHEDVVCALKAMLRDSGDDSKLHGNLTNLIRRMADAARVPFAQLDNELLLQPFTPGRGVRHLVEACRTQSYFAHL